ncbi:MAG: hypothetical protein AAGG08_10200, partial [Actinomycetota bacterium]
GRPASAGAMTVTFEEMVRVLDTRNGDAVRATAESGWPIGTQTLRFDGGLNIQMDSGLATGISGSSGSIVITDAPGRTENISTRSGQPLALVNVSGSIDLENVNNTRGTGATAIRTIVGPSLDLDIDVIGLTGVNSQTLDLRGLDSLRIGGGALTAPDSIVGARGLALTDIPSVDVTLTSVVVENAGPFGTGIVIDDVDGTIDIGTISVTSQSGGTDHGMEIQDSGATITVGSTTVGGPGTSMPRGVTLQSNTGPIDLGTGAISNIGNTAFFTNDNTGDVTFDGTIDNTSNRSIEVLNHRDSTLTFGGAITHTGTRSAINVQMINVAAATRFTGGLDLTASLGGGEALVDVAGPGSIAIGVPAAGTNTLDVTNGDAALRIDNATVAPTGITFDRIDASGSVRGIDLDDVFGAGTIAVVGDGTDGSGGTITTTSTAVESARVATPIELIELSLASSTRSGVHATDTADLVIDGVSITRWQGGFAGVAGVLLDGVLAGDRTVVLRGTASRNDLDNAFGNGRAIDLTASAGDFDITVDRTDVRNAAFGVDLRPTGTAVFDAVIGDAGDDDASGGGGRVTTTAMTSNAVAAAATTGASTLLIDELTAIGGTGTGLDTGITLVSAPGAQLDVVIEDSVIGQTEQARAGLFVSPADGTINALLRRTTVISDVFDAARFFSGGSSDLDVTLIDSTAQGVSDPGSDGFDAATDTPASSLCLAASGNTFAGLGDDLEIFQATGSLFDVAGLTGGVGATAVDTFLQATNAYDSANSTITGTNFGSANCTVPSLP